jgi:ABC-type Fe3+ transport system permease subunit
MTTSTVVLEPTTDTRSARQVARDTRRNEAQARKRLTSKGATIAAVAIAFFWTIPTFGLLVTSFRPGSDTQSTGWWTVFADPSFTLDNYRLALTSGGTALTLAASFVNSLAITIPVVVFALAIASLIAYAFAWIDFKGRNFFFIFIFALQIVPLQMALVPLLSLFSRGLTINDVTIFPGDLPAAQLHRRDPARGDRGGSCRRRGPRPGVLPPDPAARGSRAGVLRGAGVHLGVERPARGDDLRAIHVAATHPDAELVVGHLGRPVVPAVRGCIHLDHRAADRVLLAAALFCPRAACRLGERRLRPCNPL